VRVAVMAVAVVFFIDRLVRHRGLRGLDYSHACLAVSGPADHRRGPRPGSMNNRKPGAFVRGRRHHDPMRRRCPGDTRGPAPESSIRLTWSSPSCPWHPFDTRHLPVGVHSGFETSPTTPPPSLRSSTPKFGTKLRMRPAPSSTSPSLPANTSLPCTHKPTAHPHAIDKLRASLPND
jgi:hypothetical protein